jgi:hypothetical protein
VRCRRTTQRAIFALHGFLSRDCIPPLELLRLDGRSCARMALNHAAQPSRS